MASLFANKEYESTKRINTLPFRSSYVPFPIDQEFAFTHRIIDKKKSRLYIDLNGEWDFKEHKCFLDMVDLNETLPDKIPVPSSVQLLGYDYIQYVNMLYPFPFNPPYVPKENPLFHYRRKFVVHLEHSFYLNFEGVDSSFYVYINGQYVGYSQIAHSKSEFDVTSFLVEGENVIDVLVLKWCASSYLEDQDKFRFSGIFRDVYLLNRHQDHIRDFKISTPRIRGKWYLEVENLCNIPFYFSFKKKHYIVHPNEKARVYVPNPILYSVEHPYLYPIVLSDGKEKIFQRIGFRHVEIKRGIFLYNDKPIKLKGVNRHESSPVHGAAVTLEETIKDLKLIKKMGANAIRTSHYPDRSEFYELCDLYGIYVLDEADVECHGAHCPKGVWDYPFWQSFADSSLYDDAVTDREMSLYERDKNHTCVIIFSLGNESCYGKMFHAGADYIHSHDNRPIHYEGIYNLYDKSDYYTSRIDICSRMYPSVEDIKKQYLGDKKEKRPLLICEYTHAMGNSCGDVADYWKLISKEKRIIGAFVWEWCDHAVLIDGKLKYGADFPEHYHDGNFCVDGLVSPFRKMKSSTKEVAAVYGGKLYPDTPVVIKKKQPKKKKALQIRPIFDDETGSINFIRNGKKIFSKPIQLEYLRAPLDNDLEDRKKDAPLKEATLKVVGVQHVGNTHEYRLVLEDNQQTYFDVTLTYQVYENCVKVKLSYQCDYERKPYRMGVGLALKKEDVIDFVGYGPDESYIDKCVHSRYDEFIVPFGKNLEPNLKPQESGSHYHCTYLKYGKLEVFASKPYSFSCLPYSRLQLENTKHDYELSKDGNAYIHLDVAMAGVGSHACGPALEERYLIPNEAENEFTLYF